MSARYKQWVIHTPGDAAAAVATLPSPLFASAGGTREGFAAWLYMNRFDVDLPGLLGAALEYKSEWACMGEESFDSDNIRRVRAEGEANAVLCSVARKMSRLAAALKNGPHGKRAMNMLSLLATTQGVELVGYDEAGPLGALHDFMCDSRAVCSALSAKRRKVFHQTYLSSYGVLPRRLFNDLDRRFARRSADPYRPPHDVVQVAIALVMDKYAYGSVTESLTTLASASAISRVRGTRAAK